MTATAPFKVRWGFIATGGIAAAFCKDLLIDSSLRGASDVVHEVAAVASRSKDRAQQFVEEMKIPSSPAVYGSYEELVQDPNVDVVYVATPHSHHFQNVMLCLKAGKNVLCEKAFTVNAEQTKILIEEARKRKLFLMEAVWTRYFPICVQIRQLIRDGKIGEVLRVFADTSCQDGRKY
ncbi:D-xylose 1-dehydrogenase (NADP(+)) [Ascosphaera pollenicola]|nr:D-xylose 1-dehydrogenase (NADP(+)) [Ascosphaera pollenicola]